MFGSEILDVALGLVLVFLLVSLVLTAVQEAIEGVMQFRPAELAKGLWELVQHDTDLLDKLYDHPLIFALHRASGKTAASSAVPEADVSGDPRATSFWQRRTNRAQLPSYIPRETFAAALMDLLRRPTQTSPKLADAYATIHQLVGGDVVRIRGEMENWYDGVMDRVSGRYKRRTQLILFLLGLGTALLLNINAVTIARHLAVDAQSRAFVGDYAEAITRTGVPETAAIAELQLQLQDKVGLPIGWSEATTRKTFADFTPAASGGPYPTLFAMLGAVLALLAGYLITAFAAMLGAPFWFDVLNRIMVIRATVKPKEKSPDEPSEDGGTTLPMQRTAAGGASRTARSGRGGGFDLDTGDGHDHDRNDDLDGCTAEHGIHEDDATPDGELPPTFGGIACGEGTVA